MKMIHAWLLVWVTTVFMLVLLHMNCLHSNTYTYQREGTIRGNCNLQKEITGAPLPTKPTVSKHNRQNLVECSATHYQFLHGKINLTYNMSVDDVRNDHALSQVMPGGLYEPQDCVAKGGTAIIIPYRDREKHLVTLIYHLHSFLQKQRLRYGIFVVEMAMPTQFNRGLLANAGFLTASSFGKYDCFIIHDVDLLPINDRNVYTCGASPRHLVTNSTKFMTLHSQGLPYGYYVGGVLAFSGEQYVAVNGFSNLFFGWGGEDDDMFMRIKHSNMTVGRPSPEIGSYVALAHDKDSLNPPNPHRNSLLRISRFRKTFDGLSSLHHQRKALEFRQYYTWMLIGCEESSYFNKFPYVEADKRLLLKDLKETDLLKETDPVIPPEKAQYKIIHHKKPKTLKKDSPKAPTTMIQELKETQP